MIKKISPLSLKHERWMVSYADFITLLFAFFVVMYAVSSVNSNKYRQLAESLEQAFQSVKPNQIKPQVQANQLADRQISAALIADGVSTAQNQQWLEVEIKANALFTSGKAKLNPKAAALLKRLAKQWQQDKSIISVEGYTDNRPIKTARYPSNWELSAARAAAVVRILAQSGIAAQRLSAIGYGASHPIATNNTRDGRANNRRVVLVVARHDKVERLLAPNRRLIRPQPVTKKTPPAVITVKPKKQAKKEVAVVQVTRTSKGGLKFSRGTAKITEGEGTVPDIVERTSEEKNKN